MKDDRFNELMEKYVDSTKRGKDTDLQKLRNRSADRIKVHKSIPKYVLATCTILLVVIVSLSVALPILLNKEGAPQDEPQDEPQDVPQDVPQYFYCENSQIELIEISDIDEINNKYNFYGLLPSIECIESYMFVMTYKENNQDFGLFIEMSIFDEYFDDIKLNVVKEPYIVAQLQKFDNLTDSVKWRDTTVRYSINDENNDSYYSYAMTFTIDNYNYFINFESYSEMSVTKALDMIYFDEVN
ncbi:MAG: hypothetical protein K2N57_05865 [Clostridia bacterium]|nr:hypothetical protein [Clostridia bacterium]